MRNVIVTAIAAFALGGITTGVILAQAQPAGPPPGGPPGAMGGPMAGGPGGGPGAMGEQWRAGMREHHARRMEMKRDFALFLRPDDRKLTPPDVQKIAEGFLLWNGNHTWKVLNVKTDGDAIGFDIGTAEGSVIASYAMDPKTGRVTRKG